MSFSKRRSASLSTSQPRIVPANGTFNPLLQFLLVDFLGSDSHLSGTTLGYWEEAELQTLTVRSYQRIDDPPGVCHLEEFTGRFAPELTLDISTWGFVPPFHVDVE